MKVDRTGGRTEGEDRIRDEDAEAGVEEIRGRTTNTEVNVTNFHSIKNCPFCRI